MAIGYQQLSAIAIGELRELDSSLSKLETSQSAKGSSVSQDLISENSSIRTSKLTQPAQSALLAHSRGLSPPNLIEPIAIKGPVQLNFLESLQEKLQF